MPDNVILENSWRFSAFDLFLFISILFGWKLRTRPLVANVGIAGSIIRLGSKWFQELKITI